jgi:hypothetical protein
VQPQTIKSVSSSRPHPPTQQVRLAFPVRMRHAASSIGCTIALAVLLVSQTAVVEAHQIIMLGVGNISCGKWLQRRAENSAETIADQSWVTGYITSFNNFIHESGNVSAGIGAGELFAWIDGYCQVHQMDTLFRASNALIQELEKREPPSIAK